jgi:hypothetical protein
MIYGLWTVSKLWGLDVFKRLDFPGISKPKKSVVHCYGRLSIRLFDIILEQRGQTLTLPFVILFACRSIKTIHTSHINTQTDTNQGQACETAGGTSPISDSCTATSTDTITQGAVPAPPSPCTTTMHPTVSPTTVPPLARIALTGQLTDTCTGSGVAGASITFTGVSSRPIRGVTNAAGSYVTFFFAHAIPGPYAVQAHFAGQGIFGASNSQIQLYTVVH